jgi:hypothetical protein
MHESFSETSYLVEHGSEVALIEAYTRFCVCVCVCVLARTRVQERERAKKRETDREN